MKKFLIFIFIGIISACNQNSEVKVIPIFDNIYLKPNEVDVKIGSKEINLNVKDFEQKIDMKKLFDKYKSGKHTFLFNLLINEQGKVDYIRPVLAENEFLAKEILPIAENWKFKPAEKNGKAVKGQSNFGLVINFNEDGKYKIDFAFTTSEGSTLSYTEDGYKEINSEEYFVALEEMPSPKGGIKSIQEKIKYPKEAMEQGVEGRVFVKAFINEHGDVDAVEIVKGIGHGCDKMAANAVKNTKFTPGMQRGEPQKVQVVVPILFKLSTGNNSK